jgi:hypothetical protein
MIGLKQRTLPDILNILVFVCVVKVVINNVRRVSLQSAASRGLLLKIRSSADNIPVSGSERLYPFLCRFNVWKRAALIWITW